MVVFDSNVVIDVLSRDPQWFEWSAARLLEASEDGGAIINPIVLAEVSPGYETLKDLLRILDRTSLRLVDVGEEAAFRAGRAFAIWRRTRSAEASRRVLPDFLIGAHALVLGAALATRDEGIYRSHFPELTLLTPERTHG